MSRWPRAQIRHLARLGTGHTPSRSIDEYWQDCYIPWLTLADVGQLRNGTVDVVSSTKEKISELGVANSSAVVHPAGTVAMSRTASVGYSCILGVDMATSQDYVTWTCGPRLHPRFLLWVLRGEREAIIGRMQGSTHKTIYMPDVEQMSTPLPLIEEQRAIADYLDTETARIDALITKKRRMVEILEERANSEIMSWIGRASLGDEDETAKPIRRLLRKHERWSTEDGEIVTAFRDGEVTSREARGREGFTNSWTDAARVQSVRVGEVVIHGLDGFSGAIGDAQVDGVCSPVYHVCEPIEGDGAFYGRMLRLLALDGYLGGFASSTRERAVDFRNWDMFGRIPVPDVPVSEQRRIGSSIRSIRPLRDRILASEALAREYRQALVTAAVTGELNVLRAA